MRAEIRTERSFDEGEEWHTSQPRDRGLWLALEPLGAGSGISFRRDCWRSGKGSRAFPRRFWRLRGNGGGLFKRFAAGNLAEVFGSLGALAMRCPQAVQDLDQQALELVARGPTQKRLDARRHRRRLEVFEKHLAWKVEEDP